MGKTRIGTIAEVLIFIAIFSLIVSIILPSYQSDCGTPHYIACMSNMRTIATSVLIYVAENDDSILPDMEVLSKEEYCGNSDRAQCPGNRENVSPGWDYIISAAGKMSDFPDPAGNLMIWELPRNHFQTSANCGFVDCHVENIKAADFDDFVRSLQDANNLLAKLRNQPEEK